MLLDVKDLPQVRLVESGEELVLAQNHVDFEFGQLKDMFFELEVVLVRQDAVVSLVFEEFQGLGVERV